MLLNVHGSSAVQVSIVLQYTYLRFSATLQAIQILLSPLTRLLQNANPLRRERRCCKNFTSLQSGEDSGDSMSSFKFPSIEVAFFQASHDRSFV